MPFRRTIVATVLPLIVGAASAAAQGLELKRELPALEWPGCPAPAPMAAAATPDSGARAARLVAEATEAAILGDHATALDRLGRAAAMDPTSSVIAYRRARALEQLDRTVEAVTEYCRYLQLPGAGDSIEVRQRLATLTEPEGFAISQAAATAYEAALRHYDDGRLAQADTAFGQVSAATPTWSAPIYNRALVRLALGLRDPAIADLRRYLEMSPGADDFRQVLDRLSALQEAEPRNPAGALAAGLLLPGLGHFTSGRPLVGALVMGAAGGALAAGILMERSDVQCLSPPVDGRCPPDQVLREDVERPYLIAGAVAAAVIGIGGAVHAYLGVRSRNRDALLRFGEEDGQSSAALGVPAVRVGRNGTYIDLLRLRF